MIASTNNKSLSARGWTHIDLKDRHNRIVTAIRSMNNVLLSIKVKVSILVSLSVTYRIVQRETVIRVLLDLIMKAITLITTIVDHFNQGHLIRQGPCWMLHLRVMLIKLSISFSSRISHGNRVSHRLVTGHYYKSRAETQISLLVRESTRVPIKETKTEILIEIHSRDLFLLLRSII